MSHAGPGVGVPDVASSAVAETGGTRTSSTPPNDVTSVGDGSAAGGGGTSIVASRRVGVSPGAARSAAIADAVGRAVRCGGVPNVGRAPPAGTNGAGRGIDVTRRSGSGCRAAPAGPTIGRARRRGGCGLLGSYVFSSAIRRLPIGVPGTERPAGADYPCQPCVPKSGTNL